MGTPVVDVDPLLRFDGLGGKAGFALIGDGTRLLVMLVVKSGFGGIGGGLGDLFKCFDDTRQGGLAGKGGEVGGCCCCRVVVVGGVEVAIKYFSTPS